MLRFTMRFDPIANCCRKVVAHYIIITNPLNITVGTFRLIIFSYTNCILNLKLITEDIKP